MSQGVRRALVIAFAPCNDELQRFFRNYLKYFRAHPNEDVKHPDVVDWVVAEWRERTGKVFRDPDRGIRSLHQRGYLIKVSKGIYRYDIDDVVLRSDLEDFTPELKKRILERDGYKCVICGMGRRERVDLQVDHIKPKDLGGKATFENGQTLCARHNFLKKNLRQTESGKKMFIRMYEKAKEEGNEDILSFTKDILEVYEKHNINGHIEWKR